MSFPHLFQHNVEINVERFFPVFRHFRHFSQSFQHFQQQHFQQCVERFVKTLKYMPSFQHFFHNLSTVSTFLNYLKKFSTFQHFFNNALLKKFPLYTVVSDTFQLFNSPYYYYYFIHVFFVFLNFPQI